VLIATAAGGLTLLDRSTAEETRVEVRAATSA
jgi:hypothetical protein